MIQNKSRINLDPKMAWPVSVETKSVEKSGRNGLNTHTKSRLGTVREGQQGGPVVQDCGRTRKNLETLILS